MARNKLTDLNDLLFAQLERLDDEEMSKEDFKKELDRAKAMNLIARNIIDNAKVTLEGAKFANNEYKGNVPEQFRLKE
jgi:hypothetical protein